MLTDENENRCFYFLSKWQSLENIYKIFVSIHNKLTHLILLTRVEEESVLKLNHLCLLWRFLFL